MSLRVRLLFNFPYFKVLALSFVLCLMGIASIILSAVGFVKEIWGHYVGAGLWCGAFVFLTGICGIAAAHWKGVYSVRCFMGTSIVSTILSIVQVGLSAGGLDYNSKFYIKVAHYANIDHGPTKLIHGLLLAIAVLEFVLSFTSACLCTYHACLKKYKKTPTPSLTEQSRGRFLRGLSRASTTSNSSRHPLQTSANGGQNRPHRQKRSKHIASETGQNNVPENHPENRPLLNESHRNKEAEKIPKNRRNEPEHGRARSRPRGSHRSRRERSEESQRHRIPIEDIVIENVSPCQSGTSYMEVQPTSLVDAYYYVDEPPIPIDEDDELPPYEEVARDTEFDDESVITVSQNRNCEMRVGGGNFPSTYEAVTSNCNGRKKNTVLDHGDVLSNVPQEQHLTLSNISAFHLPTFNNEIGLHNIHKMQQNTLDAFHPTLPPKIPLAEREAFLREYWLSDHPQGISYCGFSRNDCPVRENIGPRTKRSRSFHQHSREREFARINALQSRRLSQQDHSDIEDPFDDINGGFHDYLKSQPNIHVKLHNNRSTSLSSAISLPAGNPPPKPPRMFSYDQPIEVKAKEAIQNIEILPNVNQLSDRDHHSHRRNVDINNVNTERTKLFRDDKKVMDGIDLGRKENKNQEHHGVCMDECYVAKAKYNPSGNDENCDVNETNDTLFYNIKKTPETKSTDPSISHPIGHSTPKSSVLTPSSPGLSPIKKATVQTNGDQADHCDDKVANGKNSETSVTSADSPREFNPMNDNDLKLTQTSSVVIGNKSRGTQSQIKSKHNSCVQTHKFLHSETPVLEIKKTNTEDELSLRPYLIRKGSTDRTCVEKSRNQKKGEAGNNSGSATVELKVKDNDFLACTPSPEIKYVAKIPKSNNGVRSPSDGQTVLNKNSDYSENVKLSVIDTKRSGNELQLVSNVAKSTKDRSDMFGKTLEKYDDSKGLDAIKVNTVDTNSTLPQKNSATSHRNTINEDNSLSTLSSRRKLFSTGSDPLERKPFDETMAKSKLPVLSLRPVQFNFAKGENSSISESVSRLSAPKHPESQDKDQSEYSQESNDALTIQNSSSCPRMQVGNQGTNSSDQRAQEQPDESQRRKPIYSIIL